LFICQDVEIRACWPPSKFYEFSYSLGFCFCAGQPQNIRAHENFGIAAQ